MGRFLEQTSGYQGHENCLARYTIKHSDEFYRLSLAWKHFYANSHEDVPSLSKIDEMKGRIDRETDGKEIAKELRKMSTFTKKMAKFFEERNEHTIDVDPFTYFDLVKQCKDPIKILEDTNKKKSETKKNREIFNFNESCENDLEFLECLWIGLQMAISAHSPAEQMYQYVNSMSFHAPLFFTLFFRYISHSSFKFADFSGCNVKVFFANNYTPRTNGFQDVDIFRIGDPNEQQYKTLDPSDFGFFMEKSVFVELLSMHFCYNTIMPFREFVGLPFSPYKDDFPGQFSLKVHRTFAEGHSEEDSGDSNDESDGSNDDNSDNSGGE